MKQIALCLLLMLASSGGQETPHTMVRSNVNITEVEEKIPKVPVVISIKKVEGNKVYFEPLIPPTLFGELQGKAETKISHCVATIEHVADLANGGHFNNMVFECEGNVRIVLWGLDFY